jgi:hypothetical protein
MSNKRLKLKSSRNGKIGYLYLPNYPEKEGDGPVKQIRLLDLIGGSVDFDIYIDLDKHGNPIGIEIV